MKNCVLIFLMFTSFVFANNFVLEDGSSFVNKKNSLLNNEIFRDNLEVHTYSYSYTYLGNDGCAFTVSVSATYDDSNGHIDYSEIYIETGCGNGNVFVHNGWSNYIHGRVQETQLNFIRQIGDGKSPVDSNFIAQFNTEMESQIKR